MNVCIDARCVHEKMHGIARFVIGLLKFLSRTDTRNTYFILALEKGQKHFSSIRNNFQFIWVNSPPYTFREQIQVPLSLKKIRYDIYFTPTYLYPLFIKRPIIMTIHDIIPLVYQEKHFSIRPILYKFLMQNTIKRCRFVLTVSHSSERDVKKFFKDAKDKVITVGNAIEEEFCPGNEEEAQELVKRNLKISSPFILWIGNTRPHKNLKNTLLAFSFLHQKAKNLRLVILGVPNTWVQKIGMPNKGEIHILEEVSDAELIALYRTALFLLLPSFYEGFCRPVVEAMACGCPVITSNTSSLPEVVGDSGMMVNPANVEEITEAALTLLRDSSLRKRLKEKGIKRVEKFRWDRVGKNILKTLELAFNT